MLPNDHLQYLSPEDFPQYPPEETILHYTADSNYPADYLSENGLQDFSSLEQRIVESFERYVSDHQEDEQLAEILPALIPIITAVAPAVVQGVSSLISNASKRRAPQRQPAPIRHSPPPQQTQRTPQPAPSRKASPSPIRRVVSNLRPSTLLNRPISRAGGAVAGSQGPTPNPQPQASGAPAAGTAAGTSAGAPAGISPNAGQASGGGVAPVTGQHLNPSAQANPQAHSASAAPLNQLINLLNHPSIQSLIQQVAGGTASGQETIRLGPEQIEVSLGSILNAVAETALWAQEQLSGENGTEIPEYLLDAEGNFLCDVSSSRERAEVLLELLEQDQHAA